MSENGEIDGAGLEDTHPMEPDHEACYRALSTRDARFDGRFFIAVRTTRIYCRPICPARTPKRENVTFFTTASAAQEAGYRPCLRCRPESSPDLGAWRGTSNTVSRALTLIGEAHSTARRSMHWPKGWALASVSFGASSGSILGPRRSLLLRRAAFSSRSS
jgi:hypothetical protein